MNLKKSPSPHYNERAHGQRPRLVILHYTGTKTAEEAHNIYMNAASSIAGPVSPHYMIDDDANVIAYVDEDKRAWHAGKAYWSGLDDINSASIGIEIFNAGHDGNLPEFTEKQLAVLQELLAGIIERHEIKPHNILGHSDVAITRKIDPGEHFPWQELSAAGYGVWPDEVDDIRAKVFIDDFDAAAYALSVYGYDPAPAFPERLKAFQRHFVPEAFFEGFAGEMNAKTARRLAGLLKLRGL